MIAGSRTFTCVTIFLEHATSLLSLLPLMFVICRGKLVTCNEISEHLVKRCGNTVFHLQQQLIGQHWTRMDSLVLAVLIGFKTPSHSCNECGIPKILVTQVSLMQLKLYRCLEVVITIQQFFNINKRQIN